MQCAVKQKREEQEVNCDTRWRRICGIGFYSNTRSCLLQFVPMKVCYDDIEVCHECDLSWPTLPKRVLELLERTLVLKVVSVVVTGRLEYESRSISCAHDNSARLLWEGGMF